jgi:hypothetical protein
MRQRADGCVLLWCQEGRTMRTYYDEAIETMPRPAIESMQEDIILRLVPYMLERSPIVRNCDQLRSPGGHVNIVAGRATFIDGPQSCMPMCIERSSRPQLDSISFSAKTVWQAISV